MFMIDLRRLEAITRTAIRISQRLYVAQHCRNQTQVQQTTKQQGMGWRFQMKGQFYAHCKYFQKIWAAVNRKRRMHGMQRDAAVAATEQDFREWKRTRGGMGSVRQWTAEMTKDENPAVGQWWLV